MDDQNLTTTTIPTMSKEDVLYGKYLTFVVAENVFGLEISYVTEIIGIQNITRVPHTYSYIKGIINLRGTIVPVMDMCMRFDKEQSEYTDRTCIVVLNTEDLSIGLVVDEVAEVVSIDDDVIQPPPAKNTVINNYVKSLATVDGQVIQLLDLIKIY